MREYKAEGLKSAIFTFDVHPSGVLGEELDEGAGDIRVCHGVLLLFGGRGRSHRQ